MRSFVVEHPDLAAAVSMPSVAALSGSGGAHARPLVEPMIGPMIDSFGMMSPVAQAEPPQALDRPRRTGTGITAGASRFEYVRGAVTSPVSTSFAVFAGCVGLGYAGAIGAVIAVACVIAIGIHAASYRAVRAYVDEQAQLRARAQREARRLRLLHPAGGTRIQHYSELRLLVEQVERLDTTEAERYELQDLLDHFVALAVSHQRCFDALRLAGASALPTAIPVIDTTRSARRHDILQRRIAHRDECLRTMARLTDELESIDELIRLIVQRTAAVYPAVELGHELDRRLWEIDELDAAMQQLSS